MEVNKSIFKRQADFLEKNGKYILQFTNNKKYKIIYGLFLFLLLKYNATVSHSHNNCIL